MVTSSVFSQSLQGQLTASFASALGVPQASVVITEISLVYADDLTPNAPRTLVGNRVVFSVNADAAAASPVVKAATGSGGSGNLSRVASSVSAVIGTRFTAALAAAPGVAAALGYSSPAALSAAVKLDSSRPAVVAAPSPIAVVSVAQTPAAAVSSRSSGTPSPQPAAGAAAAPNVLMPVLVAIACAIVFAGAGVYVWRLRFAPSRGALQALAADTTPAAADSVSTDDVVLASDTAPAAALVTNAAPATAIVAAAAAFAIAATVDDVIYADFANAVGYGIDDDIGDGAAVRTQPLEVPVDRDGAVAAAAAIGEAARPWGAIWCGTAHTTAA